MLILSYDSLVVSILVFLVFWFLTAMFHETYDKLKLWKLFHIHFAFRNNFMQGYYFTSMIIKWKVIILSTLKGLKVSKYAIILPHLNYKTNCGWSFYIYHAFHKWFYGRLLNSFHDCFYRRLLKCQLGSTKSFDICHYPSAF